MKYKEDKYLIYIFIIMSLTIVVKSYFHTFGYLSPDSTKYLELAQNLLDGNGFYLYSNSLYKDTFFSMWPVGYPVLIYLVALISGLNVFWASKVLSITFVAIIICLFRSVFKQNTYVYSLVLLISSSIEIFSFSWSETMFITTFLWFTISLFKVTTQSKYQYWLISLCFSSLLMFASRYIGIISVGVIGVVGLYKLFWKKENNKGSLLFVTSLFNIGLMSLYFYKNYKLTGFISGKTRVLSSLPTKDYIYHIIASYLDEISLISYSSIGIKFWGLLFFQFLLFIFIYKKYTDETIVRKSIKGIDKTFVATFISVGLVYIIGITLLFVFDKIEPVFFRLISPGTFILFVGVIRF